MIESVFFLRYNARMKIKNSVLCLIMVLGLIDPAIAEDRLRDELITTPDRSCGIHYLTQGNTIGWYLTEVEGSCISGLLDGRGHVTLRDAFGKIVRDIDSFFTQGYPTKSAYKGIHLKTLWLSDTPAQSLVFDLGTEEQLNIRYLGKMAAVQQPDGTYSSFDACHPAVVLAMTPDLDLFEDESIQQELINSVLNRITPVCSDANQIYFYGSSKDNPENKDIAFFADIDLENSHIKVRRLPSSPRIRDILSNPSEAADVPIPKEIRRETGLPVVQITPVKPEVRSLPPQGAVTETAQPKKDEVFSPISAQAQAQPPQPSEPIIIPQPIPTISPTSDTVTQVTQPESPPEASPSWDDVPALLTAARLLKQPVEGKALIHIARFDATGLALTDRPVALRVKGDNLPLGWVMVQGTFSQTPPQNTSDTIGFVQVRSFTPMKEK